jgi:hypothetical protein
MERAKKGKIKWSTIVARLDELRRMSKTSNLLPSVPDFYDLFETATVKRIRTAALEEQKLKSSKSRLNPSPSSIAPSEETGESLESRLLLQSPEPMMIERNATESKQRPFASSVASTKRVCYPP